MFYGLNKFFKNILPKSLFYRALLIVAVPILVLQLVITIVFFDSLWIKTNKGMTRALVNEISTFKEVYKNEDYDKEEITNLFSVYQDLNFEFICEKCKNTHPIYESRCPHCEDTLSFIIEPKLGKDTLSLSSLL